jgi:hypothetical protein
MDKPEPKRLTNFPTEEQGRRMAERIGVDPILYEWARKTAEQRQLAWEELNEPERS